MAGQIKRMIDRIISERSKGNPTLVKTTHTKLVLKGINPEAFNPTSPDDPAVMARVKAVGAELGVAL